MRFMQITPEEAGRQPDTRFTFWNDRHQYTHYTQGKSPKYVVVTVKAGLDPNDYKKHDKLYLLFNDQSEYYVVCGDCYFKHKDNQWAGGSRNSNWRQESNEKLEHHKTMNGWCQFCDPVFGNGGWTSDT